MRKIEDMEKFWKEHSEHYLDYDDKGYAAVCYTGMPVWFNRFFDFFQKKCFFYLVRKADLCNKKILDIGCGVGRWVSLFLRKSPYVFGIDIDEARLVKARKNTLNKAHLTKMSAENLKFKDGEFDFINCVTVLQHIPYKDKSKVIEEMCRVCKKNGYILIIELSDEFDNASHVFPLPQKKWIEEFEKRGFRLVETRGYEFIPLLRFIRRLRYAFTKKRVVDRKETGEVKISRGELITLKILLLISFPLERLLMHFPSKMARHGGFLFKKIK
jgi:ubiquinone/menaquinone biosynthesis C-methylase UbiE